MNPPKVAEEKLKDEEQLMRMGKGEDSDVERGGKLRNGLIDPTPEKRPMHPLTWNLLLLVGVTIYGSYTILVHLCEVDGKMPFSSASFVLITEITKIHNLPTMNPDVVCSLYQQWLSISISLFIPEVRQNGFTMPSLSFAIPFMVPAILYCLNNNIAVHMQLQMDPATYQVLGNLKILSTAFLYRLIIKKEITGTQWISLGLLALAGAANSYGGLQADPAASSAGTIHITLKGLLMISTYCLISGLSGVYTEYILKKKYEVSLHLQNSLLYTFGIFLNAGGFIIGALQSDNQANAFNLFHGYTAYTWVLVLTQAVCGLIMSAIFKHGNNITRLFLISCAMLITTVLSMIIFGLQLNTYFCAAFVLVVIALALYYKN